MNIEEFRDLCLRVPGVEECMPFGDDVVAFKIMGKMFAYFGLNPKGGRFHADMKCNPERSERLREQYEGIGLPHTKVLMWNAVELDSDVPDELIAELLQHSVDEVVRAMPRKLRTAYEAFSEGLGIRSEEFCLRHKTP